MKKLIRKFRETYKLYDYSEQDIDILLNLLDLVLEMIGNIEMDDYGYAQKLSSFISMLSSGYSNTLMDAIMIEEIYNNSINPILDLLEKKYTTPFVAITTKEISNGLPYVAVTTDESVVKLAEKLVDGDIEFDEYKKSLLAQMQRSKLDDYNRKDINILIDYLNTNKDTHDPVIQQVIFNMSKDIIGILQIIYDSFTCSKSRQFKERYLVDLVTIRNVMEEVSKIDNLSIQLLSDNIRDLCHTLGTEINSNDIMPSSIASIELKFKALEELKYKSNIIINN